MNAGFQKLGTEITTLLLSKSHIKPDGKITLHPFVTVLFQE